MPSYRNHFEKAVSDQPRGGKADDVPALLSEGEYVIPAEVVVMLGNGDPEKGSQKLDAFVKNMKNEFAKKSRGKVRNFSDVLKSLSSNPA